MAQSNSNDAQAPDTAENHRRASAFYEAGDFKSARPLARQILAAEDASAEQRAAAQRILRSSGIDPAATVIYVLSFGLLAYLIIRYIAL